MVERKNRLIDLDPSQRYGLASVTLTCSDCDFTLTGGIIVYDGWRAVRDQLIANCQSHHDQNRPKLFSSEDDREKQHNSFMISSSSELIGNLGVSGETRAQVYIYEEARPFLQNPLD